MNNLVFILVKEKLKTLRKGKLLAHKIGIMIPFN